MNKLFIFFLILLLSFGVAEAIFYTPTDTLSAGDFVTQIIGTEDNFVYEITPEAYSIVQISLTGDGGYIPRFEFFDVKEDDQIIRINKNPGEEVTYSYTVGKGKTYYIIIETAQSEEQTFYLDYQEVLQPDTPQGDATGRMLNVPDLTVSEISGFLGDEDKVDYYKLPVVEGNYAFQLVQEKGSSLRFILVDGNVNNAIDQRVVEGETTLELTFDSKRDQDLHLGIEGSVPYTLTIISPVGAPILEAELEAEQTDPEATFVVGTENNTPEPVLFSEPVPDEAAPWGWIIALIVLALGIGIWLFRDKFLES